MPGKTKLVEPGVTYPRDLDPANYPGLPAGWRAVEFAFKSGERMGMTYVRFNSATKREGCSTVKQAVKKAAVYRGLSEADAEAEALAYEQGHHQGRRPLAEAKAEAETLARKASGASKVKGEKRPPVPLLSLGDYAEHASLALLPISAGGDSSATEESWAKAGETAGDLAALRASAAKIHPLLVSRGFEPGVKLFGLHGCEPNDRFADALEGIFYEMPGGAHNGRPCFQKVRISAAGVLSCAGLYIYWELLQQEWRIGSLRDEQVPLAIGLSKGDSPAEPGNRWRLIVLEEEEIRKEPKSGG